MEPDVNERVLKAMEDYTPPDEVRIALRGKRREVTAYFIFDPLDADTLRRYRSLWSGPPGSRKGKPDEAILFVFKKKFKRVEGMGEELSDRETALGAFTTTPQGKLIFDAVTNEYLTASLADVEDTKE